MRYGLRSILRTPVKTLLFFLLIGAAAAFLCLGAGMKQSADAVLRQADGAFLTAGQLTYLGGNYPELAVDDPVMANQLENFQLGEIPGFGGQEGTSSQERPFGGGKQDHAGLRPGAGA